MKLVVVLLALSIVTGCEAKRPAPVVNLNKNLKKQSAYVVRKNTTYQPIVKPKVAQNKIIQASKPLAKSIQKIKTEPAKKAVKKVTIKKITTPIASQKIQWVWPAQGKIIKRFNESTHAKGIDISGNASASVKSAGQGTVVYSGSGLKGYGNLIIIKHEHDFLSAYAHNDKLMVKEGEQVRKGQEIAKMGKTGAERVKLHFEIRYKGKPVDPLQCLPKK